MGEARCQRLRPPFGDSLVIDLVGGPLGVDAIGFFGAGFFAIALAIRKFLFDVGGKTDAARCSDRIDLVAI
jgi:hypothetical protein